MQTREPVVAGQFYPAHRQACLGEVRECLKPEPSRETLPPAIVAGIVPHAGWTFSGALAASVFAAVKQRHETVHTFVIFGTAHGYFGAKPAVDESDIWDTPLESIRVDGALRDVLLDSRVVVSDPSAHRSEHSIEVQLPFIQHLFPEAQILPIVVPPNRAALTLGEAVARIPSEEGRKVVYVGSTDLTHYGPRYGFTPMGPGVDGLEWASHVNDREFIDLALGLDSERLLSVATAKGNACGPGAAAAAIAAAKTLGVTKGHLLAYTNSNDVMRRKMGATSRDSVGYAAIVF